MKIINKIPYVPIFINGKGPFQFLFDTGCWSTRVSIEVSDSLNLKRNERDWTQLKTLQLSKVILQDYDIGAIDTTIMSTRGKTQVDGITGYDLVQDAIVIFDYKSPHFEMWQSDQFPHRAEFKSKPMPLEITNRYPFAEVIVNDKGPYRFLIDTGSMGTNVSIEIADHLNLVLGKEVTIRGGQVNDAQIVHESSVSTIRVGHAIASNVKVLVKSCDVNSTHAGVKVDGVLGYEFLKEFSVALDYPKGNLWLSRE